MIYLIHFDDKLAGRAEHYLGFCSDQRDLSKRWAEHISGRGAKILRACNQQGITYVVAATFPGDRHRERQLKRRKNSRRLCPLCSQNKTQEYA